jgi:hypothetical protein
MDEPSQHVLRFLEALSAHVWGTTLYGGRDGLWVKLVRRGLSPTRPDTRLGISTGPRPRLTVGTSATIATKPCLGPTDSSSQSEPGHEGRIVASTTTAPCGCTRSSAAHRGARVGVPGIPADPDRPG